MKVNFLLFLSVFILQDVYGQSNRIVLNYDTPKKEESSSNLSKKLSDKLLNNLKDFSFNFFTLYTGRSLRNKYQNGATYNRFDGGRNSFDGSRLDTTGSTQLYQSFRLSYKLPKNMNISYGITYQDNLTKDVKFNNDSGSRNNGRSFNNHRISLWIPSILNMSWGAVSTSIFYERPTTKVNRSFGDEVAYHPTRDEIVATQKTEFDAEFKYGVGIQPTLMIYSSVPGLFHGLTASYEKYIYPEYSPVFTKSPFWCQRNNNCSGIKNVEFQDTGLQGTRASLGAYANYILRDKLTLKSSLDFDWDQVGDEQVGTLSQWGNNMDDIGNLSLAYQLAKNMMVEGGLTFSLQDSSADKTALFASLNLNL